MINFRQLVQSFRHAANGVAVVFRDEQSFRIQVLAGAGTLALALILEVRFAEFIVLVFLIGAVLILEMINSILERIVDSFKPRLHPMVHDIKDIMAAAVLTAALTAALVGLVIFGPRLYALL
jgi:diacylglycerol kinase